MERGEADRTLVEMSCQREVNLQKGEGKSVFAARRAVRAASSYTLGVSPDPIRPHSAGRRVDDACRVCKTVRVHVIIAVDSDGSIAQVMCDFCGSRHRYRGGERAGASLERGSPAASGGAESEGLVSDRERSFPMSDAPVDIEMLLRRVIREEIGLTSVAPSDKWRGGELVLRPGRPGLQEKSMPIDTFFHKIVMVRNRLRVLEQQINALDVPKDVILKLQAHITGCYGSLTSFNVLFADPSDRFRGTGGGSDEEA